MSLAGEHSEALRNGKSARRFRGRLIDRHPWLRRGSLMVAPWHFVPLLVAGSVRRHAPRTARRRAAWLGAYCIAVVAGAVRYRLALIPLGIAGAGATLLGLFYGRRRYGMSEGLPPGGLPLVGVRPATDPDFYLKAAERHGPVFKTLPVALSKPAVCVVGLQRGLSVLSAHDSRLRPMGITHDVLVPHRLLRSMSGDDHRHYRRLFQRALRDDVVDACTPAIEEIVASGLEELARACSEAHPAGVHPRAHLEKLVVRSMVRLFLGLEPHSAVGRTVVDAVLAIPDEIQRGRRDVTRRQAESASATIADEIQRQGALLATDSEAPASFLAELVRAHSEVLEDPTVMMNLVILARVSSIDVTGLLHWIVKMLAENLEWLERVHGSSTPAVLARHIVMETLRLEQSEFIVRDVLESFEVDDYVVPAGWNVRVCIHESHRDPAVFEEPDRFNPDRFQEHFTRHQYSPFGALAHTCLGVHTTHVIAGAFVERLASDYELEEVADGPQDFRFHWRPSHRHRVVLRRRHLGSALS